MQEMMSQSILFVDNIVLVGKLRDKIKAINIKTSLTNAIFLLIK